ncbi:DJ-1/PfpI family protein [Pedobacter sp. GR22-6]|uniref:DJ-1/PfpI family protein n=1 Tax=Pedobacter sp. GR22-6 TaxID=3127957 RepID=UPI00307EE614
MNFLKLSVLNGLVVLFSCCGNAELKDTDVIAPQYNVAVLVYPGIELLSVAGPSEVLNNAGGYNVYTVSVRPGKVHTSKGFIFLSDYNIQNAPQPDILIVPGGPLDEILTLAEDKELIGWIKVVNQNTRFTMSVCSGALILAKAGLLDGKTVTTHSTAIEPLRKLNPKTTVISGVKFVRDGKILSTAGITSGIDGTLQLLSGISGLEVAKSVSKVLEYDKWDPKNTLTVKIKERPSN